VPSAALLIEGRDYSMFAMQLPLVLLLFVPFALTQRRKALGIAVVGLFGTIMAVREFTWVSEGVRQALPVLGYSRFPAGDYRTFIYLGVLFACLQGVDVLVSGAGPVRKAHLALLIGTYLSLAAVLIGAISAGVVHTDRLTGSWLAWQAEALILCITVALALLLFRLPRNYLLPVLIVSTVLGGFVTARELARFWDGPPGQAFYDARGLSLDREGRLRAKDIFETRSSRRSARLDTNSPVELSWRGYIDGLYMMKDLASNTNTKARARVLADGKMAAFMKQPGTLLAFPCREGASCFLHGSEVDLDQGMPVPDASAWYARNTVAYRVDLEVPSLLVENEVFAPGWTAKEAGDDRRFAPVRVNGALRGWFLPAGDHVIILQYRTPYLTEGLLLSAFGFALWCALLVARWKFFARPSHVKRASV
jgi:hypothetical protein